MLSPALARTAAALAAALLCTVPTAPPADAVTADPFAATSWFVDPDSDAAQEAARLRSTDPTRAALFDRIAGRAQADWFGDWVPTGSIRDAVADRTATIRAAGALPVYVTYAIPSRDCGGYSAGGVGSPAAYRDWVDAFAAGLDGRPAVVVVEPDALAGMDCLSDAARDDRTAMLAHAVDRLGAAGASVYLDAGHSGWHAPAEMAARLREAGVERARGFSLNVSNFRWTSSEVSYARELSARTGGAHAVIDTSRNGRGPDPGGAWCNPDGRGLGPAPTTATADPVVDAYLWVKRPGESDGACNAGPAAGTWWADYAAGLAARAVADPMPGGDPAPDEEPAPGDPAAADRIAGADRVATALEVARAGWDRARSVVLARSDDPADALAGTTLAGHLDAPLLVTDPGTLDPRVVDELRRLGTRDVVVLGGPEAVGPDVVAALRAAGYPTRRVHGATRSATAAAVADRVATTTDTALLVHERSWPDALAVSGLAARQAAAGVPWPILLAGDDIPTATRVALERLGVRRVLVVGGEAVLPGRVDTTLRAAGFTVDRIAGATRHATSVAAASRDLAEHGGGPLLLATSASFADGLAAGALAARTDGVVLLVPRDAADEGQLRWVADTRGDLPGSVAIGGGVAISETTRRAVEAARRG